MMENQFVSMVVRKSNNHTFPVRIAPNFNNKQLTNKIRINHKKLPSQFFHNPHSMPDLQIPLAKVPILAKWKKEKLKSTSREEEVESHQGSTKSMRDYRSQQRSSHSHQKQFKSRDIFKDPQELTITFSRLPIGKKRREATENAYFKRLASEPIQEFKDICYNQRKQFNNTTQIDNYLHQNRKGINIRRNNHPISTLRQLIKQNQ